MLVKVFLVKLSSASLRCYAELKGKSGYVLWILAAVTLFTGCSTGRNTSATRAYHELTTRYNIYFNAEEAYHEILKKRNESFQEDYSVLLPFYPTMPDAEKSSPGGPFDPVIDKTEKAIRKHSITSKPRRDPSKAQSQEYRQWLRQEEFNPFLKKVWMLRGKAFLQNGDYDEALTVFSGMLRLFGHDNDLMTETEIWMLRAYTEMGRTYEAQKIIYTLTDKKLSPDLKKLFTEHYTYFLIREKEFEEAIPYLLKTIAQTPDYSQKKRWQFLLGQLHAVDGEKERAFHAFDAIKGLRTSPELTRNAVTWQSAIAKDSLSQVYRPVQPVSWTIQDTALLIAGIDTTKRLPQGRTLAENAALHRQWRSRNGLWTVSLEGTTEEDNKPTILFNPDKNGLHYLLFTSFAGSTNKNKLLFALSDFNFSHFKISRFNISPIFLAGLEALQIESFKSFEEVSQYMDRIQSDSLFQTSIPSGVVCFAISEINLQLILSKQRLDEYKTFYAENLATPTVFQSKIKDTTIEMEEKKEEEPEKIVSLKTAPVELGVQGEVPYPSLQVQPVERDTFVVKPLLRETAPRQSRQQFLKERERLRKEKLKQRERELKERQRKREAELKQRERERAQKIKKQE